MNTIGFLLISLLISIQQSPASSAPDGQAQEKKESQEKRIRLKTDLVQVRAVVTDKRGQPVAGLKKEDFELFEDNRPQEISFFSAETVRTSADQQRESESKNLREPLQDVGRTIVLFVDTVHTSFVNLDRVKQTLRRFVDEQMTDRDLVALVTSSAALGLMEQFTRDRQLLRAAIERLTAWRLSLQETLFTPYLAAQIARGDRRSLVLGIEIIRQEEMMPKEMRDEIIELQVRGQARQILAEASYRRAVTLATLKGVVERTAEMPGQRMIAVFSEGFSLLGTVGGQEVGDLQPAISRAVRSGVVIYAITAKGLQPLMITASHPGIPPPRKPRGYAPEREMADITSTLGASERDLETGLIMLAKDTGGEAFFNTNDLNGKLQKALNDNRIYYSFAYHAPNDDSTDKAKKFHAITVRLRNHPEYKIRTQRGYQPLQTISAEQPVTPQLRLAQAIGAPLPVTTIPVAVSADYFERENLTGQAYIQIYIDANALQYRELDEHYLFDIETLITVYDLTGKRVHLSTKVANGSFTAERLDLAKRMGYRYTERVPLKPGVYQARIGVLETQTGRIGTANGWIEVPDLGKGRLTLSALLLSREPAANQQPANRARPVESLSPAVTQGIMIYKSGAELEYHLVIHPGKEQKTSELTMRSEVAQGDRLIYQGQWVGIESRVVEKDNKGIEVGGSLNLMGLKPGVYELRVSVKTSGLKEPVQRVASFGVEP